MKTTSKKFTSVDDYQASLTGRHKALTEELRKLIKEAAPKAEELISYNMPAYKQGGVLVYYGIAKEHIGFYPTSTPIKAFAGELAIYKTSKGAIQFPLDKPLPKTLIKKIVKYKIAENANKAVAKISSK